MASKRFEKDSEEWKMFTEFWKICQQFWEPEDNDEYWEEVVNATDDFYKKYRSSNDVFAKGITLSLVDMLEEKSKRKM